MNALFLARRGVEGPLQVIEGANGIDNLLHMQIRFRSREFLTRRQTRSLWDRRKF
jgi:hypothetical protein